MLSYIKRLPIPSLAEIALKSVEFGELTRHKTLIWDLDETLVHVQYKLPGAELSNHDFEIKLKDGITYAVTKRPYLEKCLDHLAQFYEMAVFTAADQEYADLIIDILDPEKKYFQHRMYRQHCIKCEDAFVKDLRIISDRDIEDIVIVDNCILSFAFTLNSGIPICAFYS